MNLLKSFMTKGAFFRSKVARRIFLLFVFCALIPLSVLAYFSNSQITTSLYSQAIKDLHQASKTTGMTMFERLQFLETDLDMVAAMPAKGAKVPMVRLAPRLRDRLSARFKSLIVRANNNKIISLLGSIPAIPQLTKEEQDHLIL